MPLSAWSVLLLVLTASAHAQVFECPKFYPAEDISLAESPFQHRGKGLVARSKLGGAGAYMGRFNGNMQLAPARVKQLFGGRDMVFAPPRWLVCDYGGGISWWEELGLDATVKTCVLEVRNKVGRDPMGIRLVCS